MKLPMYTYKNLFKLIQILSEIFRLISCIRGLGQCFMIFVSLKRNKIIILKIIRYDYALQIRWILELEGELGKEKNYHQIIFKLLQIK